MTDSETRFELDRAIIVVHFHAESEQGIDPSQRLTYSHVAAIHRQEFSTLPAFDFDDIDANEIRSSAISIHRKIEAIIQAKADVSEDITQMEHDLNSLIYAKLLSKYPCLTLDDFEDDLENLEFLETLDRSPAYVKVYLQIVRSKYAEVEDEMKMGIVMGQELHASEQADFHVDLATENAQGKAKS